MDKPETSGDIIRIPSETRYIADVDEFIESRLRDAGLNNSVIADLAISVTEIVNNAILHGNGADAKKIVQVQLTITPEKIEVRVKDQGRGFDPAKIPDPLAEANLLNVVGRGLLIVRSLMDSVDFNFSDSGTEIVIAKSINK